MAGILRQPRLSKTSGGRAIKYLPFFISVFLVFLLPTPTQAQSDDERFVFGVELKGHYRDTDAVKFPVPFPFPEAFLRPGETRGILDTPDPGEHYEFSRASFFLKANFSEHFQGLLKVDTIDLYDRNPTSGDDQIDIDEFWIRFGREFDPDVIPENGGFYAKLGKFGSFERQDDRTLESYGLISTAFNRFEDVGLELGLDIGKHFYLKSSYTSGNPIFFRGTNSLAGDNGTAGDIFGTENNPRYGTSFLIFYDAEVEWKDLHLDDGELSLAAGFRLGAPDGVYTANFMAFHRERELQDSVNLTGTIYGGDLDLLRGVEELNILGGLPLLDRDKTETGANLWLYLNNAVVFGQYVDQEMAGLPRKGYEVEASYAFQLPLFWAANDKQLFSQIIPAVRFSHLDPEFSGVGTRYPTPSVWWEWKKLDLGVVIQVHPNLSLTLEHSDNQFERLGVFENIDEFLATFRWRWASGDLTF